MQRLLFITVVLIIFCNVFSAIATDTFSYKEYVDGKYDGKNAVKGIGTNGKWFIAGIGCGPLAVIYAIKHDHEIPFSIASNLSGKSYSYVMGFIEGYKKNSQKSNSVAAFIGWSTWILIYFMIQQNNK